jgi:GxxExxY protein
MPITVDSEIRVLSEDEFHRLAHQVMGIVFSVHNEYGRLVDEGIYKQAIRRRCEAAGIVPAQREVEIKVCHRDFAKSYFMDLLFAAGLMVEAKTVEALTNAHHAQALQYLLLTGMQHGLLVNLRREKVEKRFVSTTLSLAERRRFVMHQSDWRPVNESSHQLRQIFADLLADWDKWGTTGTPGFLTWLAKKSTVMAEFAFFPPAAGACCPNRRQD